LLHLQSKVPQFQLQTLRSQLHLLQSQLHTPHLELQVVRSRCLAVGLSSQIVLLGSHLSASTAR
jgi:hypothetical protein